MDIHFRPKNENESHLIILVFFSYIQSPSQRYNAPPIPRPVSPFCRWSLLTGFHFPDVQCMNLCVIFSRWHFNPWTVCFPGLLLPRENNNIPQSMHCALLASVWPITNSPIVKYPLSWGWCAWSAEGSLKQWFPNGKLLLLSLTKCHGMPCSLPSRITTKYWKTARLFLQDLDQNQMFKTKTSWSKTKTKTFIFVLEAPRDQDPGLEDYITA